MTHRIYVDLPLSSALILALPEGATKHTQVLRMQPGDALCLFNGRGGEWVAEISQMSRGETSVRLLKHEPTARELNCLVTLAIGMPANERMDWLVEKAAELGVMAIQPLECQRSVLKLSGARAEKRVAHWQAVAIAACEQCGRTAVPVIHPIQTAPKWLAAQHSSTAEAYARFVLSLRDSFGLTAALNSAGTLPTSVSFFSGPEGGLTEEEELAALAVGFKAVSLGPRTLRADTAPIAALAIIGSR